jgi:hypothetical protein
MARTVPSFGVCTVLDLILNPLQVKLLELANLFQGRLQARFVQQSVYDLDLALAVAVDQGRDDAPPTFLQQFQVVRQDLVGFGRGYDLSDGAEVFHVEAFFVFADGGSRILGLEYGSSLAGTGRCKETHDDEAQIEMGRLDHGLEFVVEHMAVGTVGVENHVEDVRSMALADPVGLTQLLPELWMRFCPFWHSQGRTYTPKSQGEQEQATRQGLPDPFPRPQCGGASGAGNGEF